MDYLAAPKMPIVAALPAAASNASRLVVYNNKLWFSDGTTWQDLGSTGTASAGLVIAVLGDSLSTQNLNLSPAWPSILESDLRLAGVPAIVYNCAVAGHTFYRANTVASFGGLTAVQQAISVAPNLVFVCLGINDAVLNVDGRNAATQVADMQTTMAALRAGLPTAKIVYVRELAYDATNFPTPSSTLLNKGTIGYLHQKKTSGILQDKFTKEILDDSVSATTKSRFGDWITLDTAAQAHSAVDATVTMDIWKLHRMGAALSDLLHLGRAGAILQAAYAAKAFALAAISPLAPKFLVNANATRNNPDTMFTGMFSASGTSWNLTPTYDGLAALSSHADLRPTTWYLPRNTQMLATNGEVPGDMLTTHNYFRRIITGAAPNTPILTSVDGGAFTGTTVTDEHGGFTGMVDGRTLALVVGTYAPVTYRYLIGDTVLGPLVFGITESGYAPGQQWTYLKLGTDFTMTSATLTAIPGLEFTPLPNTTYAVEIRLLVRRGTTETAVRPGLIWPSTEGYGGGVIDTQEAQSIISQSMSLGRPTENVANAAATAAISEYLARGDVVLVTGPIVTSPLQAAVRNEQSGPTLRVKAGSFLRYRVVY